MNKDLSFQKSFPFQRGLNAKELSELKEIRNKLIRSPQESEISLKYDQGGLVDIELSLQTLVLERKLTPLSGSTQSFFECLNLDKTFIYHHYFELRKLEQMASMLSLESEPKISMTKPFVSTMAHLLSVTSTSIIEELKSAMAQARRELIQLDPIFS